MSLIKRPIYKRERRAARKRGMLKNNAPISLPDATVNEIALALFAIGRLAGVEIGQGGHYDPLKDEYTVIGKSLRTGMAQDWTVKGAEVGEAIVVARILNGGKMQRKTA